MESALEADQTANQDRGGDPRHDDAYILELAPTEARKEGEDTTSKQD